MMRLMQMKTHWSAEEAYSLLMLLDEMRDVIWHNYRDQIIEYCHQQHEREPPDTDIQDGIIPF